MSLVLLFWPVTRESLPPQAVAQFRSDPRIRKHRVVSKTDTVNRTRIQFANRLQVQSDSDFAIGWFQFQLRRRHQARQKAQDQAG